MNAILQAEQICVTGRGGVSAIGDSFETFRANLMQGCGGIACQPSPIPGQVTYVGLAKEFAAVLPHSGFGRSGVDRNAQLAAAATAQALIEADLLDDMGKVRNARRVAFLLGTSHGGRSQLDWLVESATDPASESARPAVLDRAAHHYQAALVAAWFGVGGPVHTFSTACSSSGTALMHGLEMLHQMQIDVLIVVGADAFSKMTWAGFAALGAMAEQPCSPFSEVIGMNLGEGAAAIVLEREHDALARRAVSFGRIHGCATTWDAYHLTAPEPGGSGISRAILDSLACAGVAARQIDYVSAHGTGTRANDGAESNGITSAMRAAEAQDCMPPVSAGKSFTGHTLGASSLMGVLACLSATDAQRLPPTLGFARNRQGCELDYVPNQSRAAEVNYFLAQSAAFGGSNCVVTGGTAESVSRTHAFEADWETQDIVVTGLGIVSSLGANADDFLAHLLDKNDTRQCSGAEPIVAAVRGFDAKTQLPRGISRRLDTISEYSIGACHQALRQAKLDNPRLRGAKIGLMVGLCRGAAASFEHFVDSVSGARWDNASAISFPNLVMSSVGGKTSIALGLKGPSSTMVGSAEVGVAMLAHAADLLRSRADVDAIVVVAADEVAPMYAQMEGARHRNGSDLIVTEGAAAVVLERAEKAISRKADKLASVLSSCSAFAPGMAACGHKTDATIRENAAARSHSIEEAVLYAGLQSYPEPEYGVLAQAAYAEKYLPQFAKCHRNITSKTGHADACAGLFAVVAAILEMQLQRKRMAEGARTTVLVCGSGEMGSHTSVVLGFDEGSHQK